MQNKFSKIIEILRNLIQTWQISTDKNSNKHSTYEAYNLTCNMKMKHDLLHIKDYRESIYLIAILKYDVFNIGHSSNLLGELPMQSDIHDRNISQRNSYAIPRYKRNQSHHCIHY